MKKMFVLFCGLFHLASFTQMRGRETRGEYRLIISRRATICVGVVDALLCTTPYSV